MYKSVNLLLKLGLSSLVLTVALASTVAPLSATEAGHPHLQGIKLAQNSSGNYGSVGGPLAKELQGKPLVVDIYATWCAGCKNIAPTLSQLKQDYAGKVNFVVLDVTDRAKLKDSEAKAKNLGLDQFLAANKSKTATVAIVDPATGNILAMYKNNPTQADYNKVLNTALAK